MRFGGRLVLAAMGVALGGAPVLAWDRPGPGWSSAPQGYLAPPARGYLMPPAGSYNPDAAPRGWGGHPPYRHAPRGYAAYGYFPYGHAPYGHVPYGGVPHGANRPRQPAQRPPEPRGVPALPPLR